MEIIKYKYNGESKEVMPKPAEAGTATGKTGRRGRVSRWAQTDEPLCRLIVEYAQAHPEAKPREIAKALNISDGKGNYVSQVLYRHRHFHHLQRTDEPEPSPVTKEERNRVLSEAINYIHEVSKTFKSGERGEAPADETFQVQYESLKNLLGRLMIHLLRNKAIDRDAIRYWVFNTVAIRNADEYDLFMRIVFDENSWLYQPYPEENVVKSASGCA